MKVLVDTCVWSHVLKGAKGKFKYLKNDFEPLIIDNRVQIIGPIKQEILSAYKDELKFEKIKKHLGYFPNTKLLDEDFEIAARFHTICRGKGVQGSHIDFLICAVSVRTKSSIMTVDKDFLNYKRHLPIEMYESYSA